MQEAKKEVTFKEEISTMAYEPLDEVEIKLVKWSLILGIVSLVVFYAIAQMVPGAH